MQALLSCSALSTEGNRLDAFAQRTHPREELCHRAARTRRGLWVPYGPMQRVAAEKLTRRFLITKRSNGLGARAIGSQLALVLKEAFCARMRVDDTRPPRKTGRPTNLP